MLQLTNDTPFAAERTVQLDPLGVQHWVVVVKVTYAWDAQGRVRLAEGQEPVWLVPRYRGEPGRSSLLREAEGTYAHPGTDVIVNGSAYGPGGRPTSQMDVSVIVGPVRKTLRVFGERAWTWGGPTSPLRFDRMPLVYERAFGGVSAEGREAERRNPIGRGMGGTSEEADLLPNVEDPDHLIHTRRSRPPPAGFGAVAPNWSPRKERAGTYDEAWRRTKLPLYPDDFDPMFFSAASPGLHSPEPLQGGERIYLDGLVKNDRVLLVLPRERIALDTWIGAHRHRHEPTIDRVILEPDDQRLVVVWRSSLRCGLRFRDIERTVVRYKPRVLA